MWGGGGAWEKLRSRKCLLSDGRPLPLSCKSVQSSLQRFARSSGKDMRISSPQPEGKPTSGRGSKLNRRGYAGFGLHLRESQPVSTQ